MHNHEVHLQISDYLPGYIIISNPVRFYSKFASQHLRIQSSIQGNMQISHIIQARLEAPKKGGAKIAWPNIEEHQTY